MDTKRDVAVVGIACRLPKAPDLPAFWQLLRTGQEAIGEIAPARWDASRFYSPQFEADNASISKWCGLLEQIDRFDNSFFNISPREAEQMDPQQRLLLQEVWHCVEDAGISPQILSRQITSVYVGVMAIDHQQEIARSKQPVDRYAALGNYDCILANRISHFFKLRGESVSIGAACASSLVALHRARNALIQEECDYAIAAGVSLDFHPWKYISFSKARMLSPDGRCRAFDKDANGYVPGEGVTVLLLQRLDDALAAGRRIYGVVKGSAVNHNGPASGITVPRVEAQRDVILAAYRDAGFGADTVTYVEAHGTGTSLGDPIEVEALTQAFREHTEEVGFCGLGSVKSNIGHLEAAAGLAGVIKCLLMMKHRTVPKTLHVTTPNPIIDFENSPFELARESRPWCGRTPDAPLRAGVSSFGFGGSNAHVLLESAGAEGHVHPFPQRDASDLAYPFVLSAKSHESMASLVARWRDVIQDMAASDLPSVCATLLTGRMSFRIRRATMVRHLDDLRDFLARVPTASREAPARRWGVCVGPFPSYGLAQVRALLDRTPVLAMQWQGVLDNCGAPGNLEPAIQERLDAFVFQLAHLRALEALNLPQDLVTGTGDGVWAALAHAGIVTLPDVAALLMTPATTSRLTLARPRIPFLDPVSGQTFFPWRVDLEYLRQLLDGLCVPADVLADQVRKARLLNGSQHSFMRLLNAWNPSLAAHGLTVEGLLGDNPATSGQVALGDRSAILLWLIIQSVLHQLNQKWNLAHRPLPIDARLYELSSLVAHGVIPIHAAVDLLCVPENEFETVATALAAAVACNRDAQRHFTDEAQAYPLLRQHRRDLDEVASPAHWLEALTSSRVLCSTDDVSAWVLMGATGVEASLDPETTVMAAQAHDELLADGFQRTLLDLWLHGIDVDWATLYPPGSFRTANLPLYPFHGSSFWLPGQPAADGVRPPEEPRQPLPTMDRLLLSARRPVIRDHVIVGQCIVPAACFIELILGYLQRAGETSCATLRHLMIVSPLELEVDDEAEVVVDLARDKKRFELQVNGKALCSGTYEENDDLAIPPVRNSIEEGVNVDTSEIYQRLTLHGYGYETSLRVMASLRCDGSRWVATLAHVEDDEFLSPCSPALVDGCLQAVLAVALMTGQFETGELYVPYLFGAVQAWEPLTDGCVAVIDESSLKRVGDDLVASVQACDADGRCLLRLEQVRFKRVESTFMHRTKNEPQARQEAVAGDAQAFGPNWSAPQKVHEENMLELKTVKDQLATLLAEVARIDIEALDADTELRDFGMDSVALTEFAIRISETLDADFDTAELFEHQTLTAVATHLCRKRSAMAASQPLSRLSVSVPVPASAPARDAESGHDPVRLQAQLLAILSRVTEIDPTALNANSDLREFGLDSISLTEFADEISEAFRIDFDTALLFEHADIAAIAAYLTKEYPALAIAAPEAVSTASQSAVEREIPASPLPPAAADSSTARSSDADQAAIAIIGMSGRFPGSETLDSFWSNLAQGRDLITEIPASRWDWQSIHGDAKGPENRTKSQWGGFLEDVLCMDAPFFKLSPREVQRMDPQQRLVLEASWHALEDGGQVPSTLSGSQTGIYVGVCNDDYNELLLESGIKQDAHTATGTYFSIIPNRVSYFLNLKGPSIAVETACSSSLVAIHLAVSALRAGDCTMALAGGVNLCLTPKRYFAFDHAGMLAADGRCKTFDQSADGYVRGEGVGMVLLKPLAAAQADGDFIYATIRGSAINHGGSANSLTAPNPTSQADVIVKAFEQAGVDAHTVSYIETHGTGTRLGDPIEINGLKQAFARGGADSRGPSIAPHCGIGSVKTQIGHLESAAGIAGLIKVVLAMKHRTLPGSLHLNNLNPEIRLAGGPFFIVDKTQAWTSPASADQRLTPRRAGVSSFGFGGTNAHVVLEEYGATATQGLAPAQERTPQLMLLSARNNERLKAYAARVADFLRRRLEAPDLSTISMLDAAYTLKVGREHMESRLAIIASDNTEWLDKLQRFVDGGLDVPGLHAGHVGVGFAAAGSHGQEMVTAMLADGQLESVARMWVAGLDIDWRPVPRPGSPRRLPLPGYPFERRSYSVVEPLGTSDRDMQSPAVARPLSPDLHSDSGVSRIALAPIAANIPAPAPLSKPLVTLQSLPETPSERAAVAPVALHITTKSVSTMSREAGVDPAAEAARLESVVVEALAQVLLLEAGEISPFKSFQELGVDSVLLVDLTNRLNKHLGLALKTSVFYAQPTPHALAAYLCGQGTGDRATRSDRAVNASVADASAMALIAPCSAEAPPTADSATAKTLMPELKQLLAQVLFCDPQMLAIDKPFIELGLDSVLLTDFVGRLRQQYQVEIKSSALYEHTTLTALASFLSRQTAASAPNRAVNPPVADASAMSLMAPPSVEATDAAAAETLMPELKQLLAQVLFCDPQVLAIDKPFIELGLDSVLLTDFVGRLQQQYQVEIKSSALYEHTTLMALASFLARRMSAPAPAQASVQHSSWTFTHNLSPQDNVCLREHVIHGNYVLPTDAFLELIYRGLKEATNLEAVTFEQLHISSPCIGTDGRSAELRLKLDRTQEGFRVVVQGREDADREHRLHVRALARPLQGVLRPNVDEIGAPAAHDAVLNAQEIYAHPAFRALGPFYRSIRDIRIQGSSAIGRLHLTPEAHMRRDQFDLSPSIMGGLLVTGLRFADWLLGDAGQLFVPVQIDKVSFAGPLRGEAYTVQLRAREVSTPWVCYDGELVSETGGVVVAIEGLRVRQFTREDLLKGSGATSILTTETQLAAPSETPPECEIAVIGIAGRFPNADDVDMFWRNLADGVDSVREVASSRWDARRFYDSDAAAANRTHSTLGGWMNDVDAFDPEFFELSPFEAEIIEPQQRLFLQESWRAFEDAGYSSKRLSGVRCGVFVGAGAGDYEPELAAASLDGTAQAFTGLSTSILAARIAYYLNLKGPSLSIDTACSSSLVAIHLACRSLHDGESDIALAGGVSVMLSPAMHVRTTKSGMLSPDGRCRPFDQAANGIGLGEAVGVLVLKPLARALADGDAIYGVIAGSHVNQDGRTNGITAPNPAAQTALTREACRRAGIVPTDLSYVEAHGTGTPLGDPIEFDALTEAFDAQGSDGQSCAIGSVKSNIGHATFAAGVCSVVKTLLALKHQQIPPSLHFDSPNPRINFTTSPFYVARELQRWDPRPGRARLAAVSAFGFSGTNCQLVIREAPAVSRLIAPTAPCHLFVLSAKSGAALQRRMAAMSRWLDGAEAVAADVAYTLHEGRDHWPIRLAVVASSLAELKVQLRSLDGTGRLPTGVFKSLANATSARMNPDSERQGQQLLAELAARDFSADVRRDKLMALAELFVDGYDFDWRPLYERGEHWRVSLPAYPFERVRCRVDGVRRLDEAGGVAKLHPLVHVNASTFDACRFTTRLDVRDFYLDDHRVGERAVLPAVASLEMARAAGALAAGRAVLGLQQLTWLRPIAVDAAGLRIDMVLEPEGEGAETASCRIVGVEPGGEERLYAQGTLCFAATQGLSLDAMPLLDLDGIKRRATRHIGRADFYARVRRLGLALGPAFQSLAELFVDEHTALGAIELPASLVTDAGHYVLHPALMDGALQTVMALVGDIDRLHLPFAIGSVTCFAALPSRCHAYVRRSQQRGSMQTDSLKFDVQLVDDDGRTCVLVRDFLMRPADAAMPAPDTSVSALFACRERWIDHPIDHRGSTAGVTAPVSVLLFDHDAQLRDVLSRHPGVAEVTLVVPGAGFGRLADGLYQVKPGNVQDMHRLLEALRSSAAWPQRVFHLWNRSIAVSAATVEESLERGFHTWMALAQCCAREGAPLELFLLHEANATPGADALSAAAQAESEAGSAFLRTMHLEHPGATGRSILLADGPARAAELVDILLAECRAEAADIHEVRYERGHRRVREVRPFDLKREAAASGTRTEALKHRGVYLITGGLGGLGRVVARFLARYCQARLVLASRSPLCESARGLIAELEAMGAEAIHVQADVSREEQVGLLIERAQARFGALHGVIHAAGLIRDMRLVDKLPADARGVLAPKVLGTLNLDRATRHLPIDFFVCFSSVSALIGNAGQCDYAYGNRFMDCFAEQRERLREAGLRHGRSLSIDWSYWAEGGMQVAAATHELLSHLWGIEPIGSDEGCQALLDALTLADSHVLVARGSPDTMLARISSDVSVVAPAALATHDEHDLLSRTSYALHAMVSSKLKIAPEKITATKPLSSYGFDSISLTAFTNEINKVFQLRLSPTIFFEHKTLGGLVDALVQQHSEILTQHFAASDAVSTADPGKGSAAAPVAEPLQNAFAATACAAGPSSVSVPPAEPIAIIGYQGMLPGAEDLDAFWQHLLEGRDLVEEIPADRWDWRACHGDPSESGKTRARWGGFLPNVSRFDAEFFGISPREAALMDPQHRLFLETAWKTIEHAGYRAADLRGSATGLFVGVCTWDYSDLGKHAEVRSQSAIGIAHTMLANRVSYLLDFKGPSEAVDTACSSSLVALQHAVDSLRSGQCRQAIVGGVNLILTSGLHIAFDRAGMMSPQGRCRTFDYRADGYVRGEGCVALMLKPLARALSDGDPVHAVIKAAVVNHGGHANSLTSPNPTAQAELLVHAYEQAQVDPSSVSYIECHGTGTALGDPIETTALVKAFAELYRRHELPEPREPHCAIGTIKTHIGHLEAAAGVAGIVNVLLAMKHRTLPANLHFERLNPHIRLDDSPFFIATERKPWRETTDAQGRPLPLRAGVSSFGFGGTNAHVVLEAASEPAATRTDASPKVIVLSARDEPVLVRYAASLARFIANHEASGSDCITLDALAFTLQTGREPMRCRLALVATELAQLVDSLQRFARNECVPGLHTGAVDSESAVAHSNASQRQSWQDPDELARLWVAGVDIDWRALSGMQMPRRLSLPTYPFAGERHWLVPRADIVPPGLTLDSRSTALRVTDLIVRDHRVGGQHILPAVGVLERVRAAAAKLTQGAQMSLLDVVWQKALIVDQDMEVEVNFDPVPETSGSPRAWRWSLTCAGTCFATGVVEMPPTSSRALPIDVATIVARCAPPLSQGACYERLEAAGLHYGPYLRGLEQVRTGRDEALADVRLPPEFVHERTHPGYQPTLTDAALQLVSFLYAESAPVMVPFAVHKATLYRPPGERGHALARRVGKDCFDVTLLDQDGEVCVEFNGIEVRPVRDLLDDFFFHSTWRVVTPESSPSIVGVLSKGPRAVLICAPLNSELALAIAAEHAADRVVHVDVAQDAVGALAQVDRPDEVYFVGGGLGATEINDLQHGDEIAGRRVLALFRLVRALGDRGWLQSPLRLRVVTHNVHEIDPLDEVEPYDAALTGFTKTLAHEFPDLDIAAVDVAFHSNRRNELLVLAAQLKTMSRDPSGSDMAVRGGRPWVRSFEALVLPRAGSSLFRKGGVYLILGGAGGIGLALSLHLAQAVGARLILLGRREASPEQLQAFEHIKAAGGDVLYLQVDATDRAAMQGAVENAKARFGALNGVFHSALVLADKAILQMDEPTLQLALAPKLAATVSLCAAVRDEPLDFLTFFSSVQSFSGNPGQANYAAGCTFVDAFARSWQAEVDYPIKVVNWGVWGEVGAVATEPYLKRLRDQGAQPILTREGMEAIARVLNAPHPQLMAIKARSDLLQRLGVRFDRRTRRCPASAMTLPEDAFTELPSRPGHTAPAIEFQQAFARLEQAIPALLTAALRQAGIPATTWAKGASALRQAMGPLPEYSSLFEAICVILERAPGMAVSELLVDLLQRLKAELPILDAHIVLLGACLTDLVEVVSGRKSPTEVMFPRGSKALVEPIYRGNAVVDACQLRVADITAEYLRRHAERSVSRNEPVRILEIGAGTGATTAFVLQAVTARSFDDVRYTYTDVSPAFIAHGQARYAAQYPFVDCRVLDITCDPVDQDFEPGSVDIVIASNVLHATPRIETTLAHAKSLLKTGGLLVINEITAAQDFSTLTFGLTHGWWSYEDGERRIPNSPLLDASSWQHALDGAGFDAVQCLSGSTIAGPLRSHVIVGYSDGWISLPTAFSETAHDGANILADHRRSIQTTGGGQVPALSETDARETSLAGGTLKDAVRDHLRNLFADVLNLSREKIVPSAGFDQFGVDSLVALDMQRRLEADFGKLPPTLLFQYMTIDGLTHYLVEHHPQALSARFETSSEPEPAASLPSGSETSQPPALVTTLSCADTPVGPLGRDIAIIGIAGRYPLADNLDEFWANLHAGRECITEIPPGRWDADAFFDSDASGEDGRSYCRWGGFLRDPWAFDAAFFGVSHREAEEMTPMERQFLEVVWETLEDAGIPRRRLAADKRRVGVFVGAMYNQYGLGDSDDQAGKALAETSSYWLIANRTSYFFDFHGPSIAIDTACSASLTAVHLACQNLADGSCDTAIAGGINLTLHPSKYVAGSLNRVLSTSARAAALGDGDGHLPGEGVGAVLLKPLAQAIADGDRIHAVIKASGVNHGGRTSGFTVPNPNAQADLVVDAFDRSGIDPRSISYVESAANGSALADAIEVAGLTQAFRCFTTESGFCPLGSVKANIGHLEAASGMSQLAKVVLQLRHRRFAPTLHAEPTNPRIELQGSPFRLQVTPSEWHRPISRGEGCGEVPRRALINSFGAGGANAYLVVEEAPVAPGVDDAIAVESPGALPWVFSARNPQQLRELVGRMKTALAGDARDIDVSWTLLIGREALQTRLAFVASDKHEALRRLESFLKDGIDEAIFCSDDLRGGPAIADSFAARFQHGDLFDTEGEALGLLARWMEGGKLRTLTELWAAGVDVDWRGLPQQFWGRRISLPSYPFARERAYRLGSDIAPPGMLSVATARVSEILVAADTTDQELTRVQADLRQMVRDLTRSDEDIDLDCDLRHAGFDSLVIVRLYNRVKDRFGPSIPLRALFEHSSLRKLAAFIVQALPPVLGADVRKSMADAAQGTPRAASRLRSGSADSLYRAVVLREPCESADLRVEAIEPVPPQPHEVQVLVKAFSLNFGDLLCMSGSYPSLPAYPFTPGFEIAGVVLACGSAVTRLRKGDAVFGLTGAHLGGQADIATVPECQLALKPASVDFETACAYPAAYLAASRIFKKADVKAGETILIQAAASGNGLMAVRFAQERGATVIATASNATKLDHLRSLGVQHVFNYMQDDFIARVLDATQGRGVDVVVNSLSGDAVQKGLQLLAPGGRYIELAIAGLTTGDLLDLSHLTDNQSFHSIDVRKQMQRQPELWATEMAAMTQHLALGFAVPKIARVLPLTDIRRAYELLRDRHSVGKVVVVTSARASAATDNSGLDDEELDRLLDQLQSGSLTPEEAVLREGRLPDRTASYLQSF